MNLRAHFSWTAPRDLFFLSPPSGTPASICRLIKKDVEQTLLDKPALEALEDYYNLSGATEIELDGKVLPCTGHNEDEPGEDLYRLDVEVSGELRTSRGWSDISSWDRCEIWDEIYQKGNIAGDPQRFGVRVRRIG